MRQAVAPKSTRICTPTQLSDEVSEPDFALFQSVDKFVGLVHRRTKELRDLHASLRMNGIVAGRNAVYTRTF